MKVCKDCLVKAGFKAVSEYVFGTCAMCKSSPVECTNFNNALPNCDKDAEVENTSAIPNRVQRPAENAERGSYLWLDNARS